MKLLSTVVVIAKYIILMMMIFLIAVLMVIAITVTMHYAKNGEFIQAMSLTVFSVIVIYGLVQMLCEMLEGGVEKW